MPLGKDTPKRTDTRIVASTNVSLRSLERTGHFRKDLAYRLRTHQIDIPPLRERLDDLPLLVDHLLAKAARALDKTVPQMPDGLIPLLRGHGFAGNVRELESMVFDALSRHRGGPLPLAVFEGHIRRERSGGGRSDAAADPGRIVFPDPLPTIRDATRLLVAEALRRAGGNQTAAAAMLGITQQALSKRLRQKD